MTIRIPCNECSGRGSYVLTNSNDPCARLYRCEECDGTGEAPYVEDDEECAA